MTFTFGPAARHHSDSSSEVLWASSPRTRLAQRAGTPASFAGQILSTNSQHGSESPGPVAYARSGLSEHWRSVSPTPSLVDSGYGSMSTATISDSSNSTGGIASPYQSLDLGDDDSYTHGPELLSCDLVNMLMTPPESVYTPSPPVSLPGNNPSVHQVIVSTQADKPTVQSIADSRRTKLKSSALAALKDPIDILRRISYLTGRHTRKAEILLCPLCPHLESIAPQDLIPHIAQHVESLHATKHSCKSCDISFVHHQDLLYHDIAATHGTCGFEFSHRDACTGHHAAGGDRSRFKARLYKWELAQLQRFKRFCILASSKLGKTAGPNVKASGPCRPNYDWETLPKLGSSHTVPNSRSTGFDNAPDHIPCLRSTQSSDGLRSHVEGLAAQNNKDILLSKCDAAQTTLVASTQHHDGCINPIYITSRVDSSVMSSTLQHATCSQASQLPDTTYIDPASACGKVDTDDTIRHNNDISFEDYVVKPTSQLSLNRGAAELPHKRLRPLSGVCLYDGHLDHIAARTLTPPDTPLKDSEHPNVQEATSIAMTPPSHSLYEADFVSYQKEGSSIAEHMDIDLVAEPQPLGRETAINEAPEYRLMDRAQIDVTNVEFRLACSATLSEAASGDECRENSPQPALTRPNELVLDADQNLLTSLQQAPEVRDALCEQPREARPPQESCDPSQPTSVPLQTWLSIQATQGMGQTDPDAIDRRADTPSSIPNISEWTGVSSPSRALGDRIHEYFASAQHIIDHGLHVPSCESQLDTALQRVYSSLTFNSPMTLDRILTLAYAAAQRHSSFIDESSVDQWRSLLVHRCETTFDYHMFAEAVHYIYDAIRIADDSYLDACMFVADLCPIEQTRHDQECGSSRLSSTGTSDKSSWTSFAPFGGQSSSNTDSAHGHHHQRGAAVGSGHSAKANSHKRGAPDDGANPGSSKRIALAEAGDAPFGRVSEQLSCVIVGCLGTDAYISDILRKLEVHSKYICGECYESLESRSERIQHQQQCGSHRYCVYPDCPLNRTHDGSNSAAGIMLLRHPAGDTCPLDKSRGRDRWRMLFAVCYPQCTDVPEPVISSGPNNPHGPRGQATLGLQRHPTNALQRLARAENLLHDADRENAILKERIQQAEDRVQQMETEKVTELEAANTRYASHQARLENKVKTLEIFLKLCVEAGGDHISAQLRTLIAGELPDTAARSVPEAKQIPPMVSACPATPSSSLGGLARREPYTSGQSVMQPCMSAALDTQARGAMHSASGLPLANTANNFPTDPLDTSWWETMVETGALDGTADGFQTAEGMSDDAPMGNM